jgi:hypothetical protein
MKIFRSGVEKFIASQDRHSLARIKASLGALHVCRRTRAGGVSDRTGMPQLTAQRAFGLLMPRSAAHRGTVAHPADVRGEA